MILLLKSNAGYVENAKKQRLSQNDCVRSSPFVVLYKHTDKLLLTHPSPNDVMTSRA